jgi:hypothetical protein
MEVSAYVSYLVAGVYILGCLLILFIPGKSLFSTSSGKYSRPINSVKSVYKIASVLIFVILASLLLASIMMRLEHIELIFIMSISVATNIIFRMRTSRNKNLDLSLLIITISISVTSGIIFWLKWAVEVSK